VLDAVSREEGGPLAKRRRGAAPVETGRVCPNRAPLSAYGKVFLVRKVKNELKGQLFAMKVLKKANIMVETAIWGAWGHLGLPHAHRGPLVPSTRRPTPNLPSTPRLSGLSSSRSASRHSSSISTMHFR
jgi:hypothetical protein